LYRNDELECSPDAKQKFDQRKEDDYQKKLQSTEFSSNEEEFSQPSQNAAANMQQSSRRNYEVEDNQSGERRRGKKNNEGMNTDLDKSESSEIDQHIQQVGKSLTAFDILILPF
jgi:hypothetical protein